MTAISIGDTILIGRAGASILIRDGDTPITSIRMLNQRVYGEMVRNGAWSTKITVPRAVRRRSRRYDDE